MNRPIPAEILERRGNKVSRDTDGELVYGYTAEEAEATVKWAPNTIVKAVMSGDMRAARISAQRIAQARDALPTPTERGAVPYRERLQRALNGDTA